MLSLISTAWSVFKMVVEGLRVSCHENLLCCYPFIILTIHYIKLVFRYNIVSIILQCLTHFKMADNTVSKEPLHNPFYVHPLHDKLRIVINVLNIFHKPRARMEFNYVNIKNISDIFQNKCAFFKEHIMPGLKLMTR